MSMALWLFSDRQLSSIPEWQAAIDAEGWNELLAAWMAATAYARETDGMIFDCEGEGRLCTPAEARALVEHFESPESLARMQAIGDELSRKE